MFSNFLEFCEMMPYSSTIALLCLVALDVRDRLRERAMIALLCLAALDVRDRVRERADARELCCEADRQM
jgi:hypothetical protein